MDITNIILSFFILILLGAIFAFPMLIPPLRHRGQQKPLFRIGLIAFCSLAAWILPTLSISYLGGTISVVFSSVTCSLSSGDDFHTYCSPPIDEELMGNLEHELGLRYMMPPPLQKHCFTGISDVCEAADTWPYLQQTTWLAYLLSWLIMSIIGITTASIGWRLTWPVEKEKRKIGE